MKKLFIVLLALNSVLHLNAQVNLQTGTATFSLPIFNWQDDRSRLSSAIGLDYSSGNGLKVNEIASNIGQGWSLMGGGVVTRMQVGQPDDQMANEGDGTTSDVNKYPAGYLYNPTDASQGCPNGLLYFPLYGDQNHIYKQHNSIAADREQDYFAVQFNGRSAMFVLGKNNGDQGIAIGNNKLKIWFQRDPSSASAQHIRTTISAFFIQDENGLIYTFNQPGLAKVLHIHPAIPGPGLSLDQPTFQPTVQLNGVYYQSAFDDIPLSYNPYVVSNWYLTSIHDPLSGRSITFNYTIRSINNQNGDVISYTTGNGIADLVIQTSVTRYVTVTHNQSITQTPVLTSVQFPDNHAVIFNYDVNNPRVDLNGDYPMSSIELQYNYLPVARYLLGSTYFVWNSYGYPATDDQRLAARLCLRSITKVGAYLKESQSPYLFDYYTGTNTTNDFVPPPFYYEHDNWGYYNPASYTHPPVNPMPLLTTQLKGSIAYQLMQLSYDQLSNYASGNFPIDNGYPKNGLLKTITYPAGKTLTYEYQQNSYNRMVDQNTVQTANNTFIGGVHVSRISETDGGYSNGSGNPIVTNYTYVDATGTITSQWGYENALYSLVENNTSKVTGAHSHPVSGCSFDFIYPGILSREESQSISNESTAVELLKLLNYTIVAASFTYDIVTLAASSNPISLIYDVIVTIAQWVLTNCEQDAVWGTTTIYQNGGNFNGNNTYPILFSRVEVAPGSSPPPPGDPQPGSASSGIGKTVFEFTDFHDYALWDGVRSDQTYRNLFSMKQRAAGWAYGLPKKTTVYDASGYIVKQTENRYNFSNAQLPSGSGQSCNCDVEAVQSTGNDTWAGYASTSAMSYSTGVAQAPGYTNVYQSYTPATVYPQVYQIYTGRVELTDTYERTFKQGSSSDYQEVVTHYDYNPNNFQVKKITTTKSNGDKVYNEMYYSSDYVASGTLATMNSNNIVNDVVASYTSLQKAGSSNPPTYLGAKVTEYGTLANGQIKPFRDLVGRSSQPVTNFSFSPSNPFSYPNLVQKQAFFYDNQGVSIATEDEGGRWVTNIYDANNLIVASVMNADPAIDKPSYTSFENNIGGGWVSSGSTSFSSSNSVTGNFSLQLSAGSQLTASLNPGKPYVVSFWSTTNGITVSGGATRMKTGPTINGTTYYEYLVPQGSGGVSLTATGVAIIDELRAYPNSARMRTTSYEPIIGKTAECDENNRITYYEYDNLSRLRFVKDEYRNIVRMYEYNDRKNSNSVSPTSPASHVVYVLLLYQNQTTDDRGNTTADIVAYFYADAGYSQAAYVNNATVNYQISSDCSGVTPDSKTGSGTSFVVYPNATVTFVSTQVDQDGRPQETVCQYNYTLTGSNIILQ